MSADKVAVKTRSGRSATRLSQVVLTGSGRGEVPKDTNSSRRKVQEGTKSEVVGTRSTRNKSGNGNKPNNNKDDGPVKKLNEATETVRSSSRRLQNKNVLRKDEFEKQTKPNKEEEKIKVTGTKRSTRKKQQGRKAEIIQDDVNTSKTNEQNAKKPKTSAAIKSKRVGNQTFTNENTKSNTSRQNLRSKKESKEIINISVANAISTTVFQKSEDESSNKIVHRVSFISPQKKKRNLNKLKSLQTERKDDTSKNLQNNQKGNARSKPGNSTSSEKQLDVENKKNLRITKPQQTLKTQQTRRSSRISFSKFNSQGTSTPNTNISRNLRKRSTLKTKTSPIKPLLSIQPKTRVKPRRKVSSPTKSIVDVNQSILKTNAKKPIYMGRCSTSQVSPRMRVQFNKNTKGLRSRRPSQKYQEYDTSQTEEEQEYDAQNIPTYKQPIKEKVSKKKDIYEFEADSCENSQSDSDNEYDKDIIQEMALIKKLEKKKKVVKVTKRNVKKQVEKIKENNIPEVEIQLPKNTDVIEAKAKKINIIQNVLLNLPVKNVTTPVPEVEFSVMHNDDTSDSLENEEFEPRNLIEEVAESFMESQESGSSTAPTNIPEFNSTFKKPLAIDGRSMQVRQIYSNPAASPCRPNLMLRNGPYYLQTKGDSLPAFNQDVVLNSTIVESRETIFNCRLSAILPREDSVTIDNPRPEDVVEAALVKKQEVKKTKQSTILKFVGKESTENKMQCTLFDEDLLLSPVKTSSPMIHVDNPRVLRDLTNIDMQSSVINTPARESTDVMFFALGESGIHVEPGKPTRFPVKLPKVQVDRGLNPDITAVDETTINEEAREVLDSPVSQTKEDEDDAASKQEVVGIFEDFDGLEVTRTQLPSFTYTRPRRKRARVVSYHSDSDEEEVAAERVKGKRKKKWERTKKEVKEYEDWASNFNKLCEEVEEHTLEVEYL